jgi:hypothetical protein
MEARRLGIPVVAVVDTNCDPDQVDYVIPGNDDALRAIRLFTNKIAEACLEGRQQVWFVDITTETKPMGVSNWTVKEAEGNYCTRGGRYGSHSSNEAVTSVYHKRIMFFTWFNAGLRALDVRDPYNPKEIAYYIPAMTKNTIVLETPATQRGKVNATAASDRMAIQSNNTTAQAKNSVVSLFQST